MHSEYGSHGATDTDVGAVRGIYAAFAERDIETALAFVADDVVFEPMGTARITGRTEPYLGHDGVRQYFAEVGRVWDELALYADDVRAARGSVVVFGRAVGSVNGEPVSRRVVWTWRLRDGKAVWMRANDVGESR